MQAVSVEKSRVGGMHALDLSGRGSQIRDISSLMACQNLHTLTVDNCHEINDISSLAACQNLHTLHLWDCPQISDISSLASCPKLHTLSVDGVLQPTSTSITGLTPALNYTPALHAAYCRAILTPGFG